MIIIVMVGCTVSRCRCVVPCLTQNQDTSLRHLPNQDTSLFRTLYYFAWNGAYVVITALSAVSLSSLLPPHFTSPSPLHLSLLPTPQNVEIKDFKQSWSDGLAFCAILHSFLPDKIPYDDLTPNNPRQNFTVAFDAAKYAVLYTK